MVRKENWTALYSEYLKERMKMPFIWSENDCMSFVCKGVETITGESIFSEYEGYDDEISASEVINSHGGISMIIHKHLGSSHSNPLKAKRGDVVIFKNPMVTGGLVDDSGSNIVSVSPTGLVRLPLTKAYRIWSY